MWTGVSASRSFVRGDSERAIEVVHAHMPLDPFYEPYASVVLAVANYTLEQYSGGIVAPARFCCPGAQIPACHALLAATLVRTGQLEEVRAELAEVLRTRPRLTISGVGRRLAAFSTSLMQCAWRGCPSRRHVSSLVIVSGKGGMS
jgi:hypothetical protein